MGIFISIFVGNPGPGFSNAGRIPWNVPGSCKNEREQHLALHSSDSGIDGCIPGKCSLNGTASPPSMVTSLASQHVPALLEATTQFPEVFHPLATAGDGEIGGAFAQFVEPLAGVVAEIRIVGREEVGIVEGTIGLDRLTIVFNEDGVVGMGDLVVIEMEIGLPLTRFMAHPGGFLHTGDQLIQLVHELTAHAPVSEIVRFRIETDLVDGVVQDVYRPVFRGRNGGVGLPQLMHHVLEGIIFC